MRGTVRHALRWMAAAVVVAWLGQPTTAQKFFPDDPLDREPTPLVAIDPGPRNLSFLLEAASATFGHPGERHPAKGVIPAQGVNTLGEVLDSAWFVNRQGRTKLDAAALQRGSGDANPPSAAGPWRVLLLRSQGARPTIVFRDASNQVFLMRFDPVSDPELATGADMVASRFFHAIGYHVPETYLVTFDRARLVPETNSSDITSFGVMRGLVPEDIDRLLKPVARRRDGQYRAVALRIPTEAASLIGPFQMFGVRSDDPNDIVPHEHRRELRGLQVFSAWLNHTRMDPFHTFDVVVEPAGEPRHIRHYLFDFMGALGSGVSGPKPVWEGRDPIYAQHTTVLNMAGLGLYTPAWMRAKFPDLPAVGRFESATFEPEKWMPVYDIAPFANRLPDDTFWAARIVMSFSDDDIRAIVRTAQYSDPAAERWVADSLIERRNRIGRAYFERVLPLDDIAARDGALAFADLAVRAGYAAPRTYRIEWSAYDNRTGMPSTRLGPARSDAQIPSAVSDAAAGGYALARITADGLNPGLAVRVFLRREGSGLRVVGVDHEWPDRTLVDPRVVARPAVNRFATLEPERQTLFATYARSINAKTGQTRSPDERFRELTPSEQTTFDGVTHALLHSSLTDDRGQSLGRAFDLVASVERIAGQQAGRSGDQQFRLYVTLRPGARDTLERSREFVRNEENTVYHAGYPHSYRLGSGAPSAQFSLAEDGLTADIDVDYRASKAPQALFNGHLTSSNSDVRAGDNAKRHDQRWNGFTSWWVDVFGSVPFTDASSTGAGPFGTAPSRPPTPLPPNRPSGAPIADVADAAQEFFTDWVIRRDYREALAFLAPDVYRCVADSADMAPSASPERLRQAALGLLEKTADMWGRPRNLSEAMNPVLPWSPSVRVVAHTFDRDFTIVEAPNELGARYECGETTAKGFVPTTSPQYGTYYGALLQVVHDGEVGGTIVFVWRRVDGAWKVVSYRTVE